jgi:glycosyltransferase involved in cell wall biosynthesis
MKLSILLVVLNNKAFIAQAMDNFLAQSCPDAELLVMDGASTDGTLSIIQDYARRFSNIRYVSEKDAGQSDAMNKGLRLANGEFVSFLNVDDYYSEGVLNEVVCLLHADASIDFITGNCNVWDAQGELIYLNRPTPIEKHHVLSGYHFPVNPTAYFYRKSIHEKVGFYNEKNHYNMDLEFIIQTVLQYKITYVDRIWGNFRMLPNSKTFSDQSNNQLEVRKRALLKRYLNDESIFVKFKVRLYKIDKVYTPRILSIYRKIRDKIGYEFSKFNTKNRFK